MKISIIVLAFSVTVSKEFSITEDVYHLQSAGSFIDTISKKFKQIVKDTSEKVTDVKKVPCSVCNGTISSAAMIMFSKIGIEEKFDSLIRVCDVLNSTPFEKVCKDIVRSFISYRPELMSATTEFMKISLCKENMGIC